jgi:hypothetical protein
MESEVWEAVLSIRNGKNLKLFKTEYLFNTRGEAVFHCITIGNKIIDGELEEFTLDGII